VQLPLAPKPLTHVHDWSTFRQVQSPAGASVCVPASRAGGVLGASLGSSSSRGMPPPLPAAGVVDVPDEGEPPLPAVCARLGVALPASRPVLAPFVLAPLPAAPTLRARELPDIVIMSLAAVMDIDATGSRALSVR